MSSENIFPPYNLRCEYTSNPLGIDIYKPRFSWVLRHKERDITQKAYQIIVATSKELIDKNLGDMWDSGKVESEETFNIVYDGKVLESFTRYYWKVRWWDNKGNVSEYSKPAWFETAFLKDEWTAKWIGGGQLYRKDFVIRKDFKKARLYITGLGYYEAYINGKRVGDRVLDPGWTDYKKKVLYSVYDITSFLRNGKNTIGVILGNGRYIEKYGYGPKKLIAEIRIWYSDDDIEVIGTDQTWKTSDGPIVSDSVYDGEVYDARLEKEGWNEPGYDDNDWKIAELLEAPGGRLVSQATFPVIKVIKKISPVKVSSPKPGVYIYDFGQNFTGWVRLKVSGPRGTRVTMRYSELLYPDGTLNVEPNRSAKATDVYILKGEDIEYYEPHFTYHGFRYVELTGFPGTPSIDTLEARVVHSSVEPIGSIVSSNELINQIHKNIIWGQVSNLMSVPTDCPQRDERMGWMGDAQLSAEEAIYNFWMPSFYEKWIDDMLLAQNEDGSVPDVVPPYWKNYPADPAWGTAFITIPWYLYLYYGDKRILEKIYEGLKKWVDFLHLKSEDYIVKIVKYGDWCPPMHIRSSDTPEELTSTWYFYHDSLLLSKIASILGYEEDSRKYSELAEKIKEAFNKKYLTEDKRGVFYKGKTFEYSQTSNVLPLYFNMPPRDKSDQIFSRLVNDIIVKRSKHLNTGIIGTRFLFDVLTNHGKIDLAYEIAIQESYPSWGYMIREGATTVWERWEYLVYGGMNSHNHIMFGSIDAWFYKFLGGINIDEKYPGFRRIVLKPNLPLDLKWVHASVNTISGLVEIKTVKRDNVVEVEVNIPVNTKATLYIPKYSIHKSKLYEGETLVYPDKVTEEKIKGIHSIVEQEDVVVVELGSGRYIFCLKEK